jgi:hypothetical protein
MLAYSFDKNGKYLGTVIRQPDPMSPGEFLMPAMATEKTPPSELPENCIAKFSFSTSEWEITPLTQEAAATAEECSQEVLVQSKWQQIRDKRNNLLCSLVDTQVPYLTWGTLTTQEVERYKNYRQALLDVPQNIQAKIDAGEIPSVLDIDVEAYAWPEMAPLTI